MRPKRKRQPARQKRPRVPLPRQRGGVHEEKKNRPIRRKKYKDAELDN